MKRQDIIAGAKVLLADHPHLAAAIRNAEMDDKSQQFYAALDYLEKYLEKAAPKATPRGKWQCERCGKRLPKTGYVWHRRHQNWHGKTSGYYCDMCADAREGGLDY